MKFAQVLFLFVVVNEKKKQREKEQHRKGGENRTMGHVTNRRKNMVKEEHGEEGVRFRFRVRSVGTKRTKVGSTVQSQIYVRAR